MLEEVLSLCAWRLGGEVLGADGAALGMAVHEKADRVGVLLRERPRVVLGERLPCPMVEIAGVPGGGHARPFARQTN
jgi:hypothetical protein